MDGNSEKWDKFFVKLAEFDMGRKAWAGTFAALWTVFMAAAALEVSVALGHDPFGLISSLSRRTGTKPQERKAPAPSPVPAETHAFIDISLPENQKMARKHGLWGLVKQANPQLTDYEIARKITYETGPENLGYRGPSLKDYNLWRPKNLVHERNGRKGVAIKR